MVLMSELGSSVGEISDHIDLKVNILWSLSANIAK